MDYRTALESLKYVRLSDPDHHPGPWQMGAWAIATDGRIMLMVQLDLVNGELPGVTGHVRKLASDWVVRPHSDTALTASYEDILTFCGEKPKHCDMCRNKGVVDCDECDGSGRQECYCRCGDEHEAECDECGGDGSRRCPECRGVDAQRPARLLGEIIDRLLLADLIRTVNLNQASMRVSVERLKYGSVFLLSEQSDAPRWRALLMGMDDRLVKASVEYEKPETWQVAEQSR